MAPPGKRKKDPKHPYGITLLSHNKTENFALWGPSGVGYIPIDPSVCASDADGGQKCPYYHNRKDATKEGGGATETPIHLLIASFRDRLCPRTLHNAFSRAENPSRVYVRIVEQTEPDSDLVDDRGCWDGYCEDYNPNCEGEFGGNVKTVHMDAVDARGPTDARSKLSAMVSWDYVHRDEPEELDFQR